MLPTIRNWRVKLYSGRELEGDERRTMPYMPLYEVYSALKARQKQLEGGDKVHSDCPPELANLTECAEWEFYNGKLDGSITRGHPNGDYEVWKFSEVIKSKQEK
ncbi:hypothetical protein OTU49_003106 [Cherax quadricarinatus]|uniref:Uncharacterized protein n=1 Tax=Cherax quadricarinatus TaxID=27406 RepID=A0AAW0XL54_CHEQU